MMVIAEGLTDIGQTRHTNEDYFLLNRDLNLFVVCDGLGGHSSGEVASELAANAIAQFVRERASELAEAESTPGGHFRLLKVAEGAVQHACATVYRRALEKPELAGMGTTATVLLVVNDKGLLAHVGDCRLYLLRKGELHQLTSDHTMANELIEAGALERDYEGRQRHILTRALGHQESVQVDSLLLDLFPGDTCLLCSDGLSSSLSDTRIGDCLRTADGDGVTRDLVQEANIAGGDDNITAVVVRVPEGESAPATLEGAQRALEKLASTAFLEDLPLRSLNRIYESASTCRFQAGEEVISEGHTCAGAYLVLEGTLHVVFQGQRAATIRPGSMFGEPALVRSRDALASVKAGEDATLLLIERRTFQQLTRRYPRLGMRLLRLLAGELSSELDLEAMGRPGPIRAGWF